MSSSLIQDLAVVLLVSGFTALVCQRFRQPKLIGYVLAGLIIGPHTPPFSLIRDESTIRILADIGVVFLMFSLGLDFNVRKLRRVGATAIITALLDVGVMVWLGYLLGRKLGWTPVESLFLGAIVCDSSTIILARSLQDLGRAGDRFAGIAVGITIVEDVLAVVMIAVLTGLAATGTVHAGFVALRIWQLVLFMVLVTVAGLLTVPRILNYIARFRSDELLVVALVGMCFGVALLAVQLHLSLALGAVLAGAIASESLATPRISALVAPLRHVFSAVFFVTIGLRLNPEAIMGHLPELAVVTLLVIAGKAVTNTTGVLLTGHSLDTSLRVGAGMAQIGEFAFIIAALAVTLGVGGDVLYQVGVAAAVLTNVLNPYLLRGADRAVVRLDGHPLWQRWDAATRFYSQWTDGIGRGGSSAIRRICVRSFTVIMVNVILICAVFGAAGYVAKVTGGHVGDSLGGVGVYYALLCLGAAAASLPLYVVTVRKIDALAMVMAEMAVPMTLEGGWTRPVRTFITHAITLSGGAALLLLTHILSSTMLASRETFFLLVALTAACAMWARRRLSRMYSRAESALHSMIADTPGETAPERRQLGPDLAQDIEVEPFTIESAGSGAAPLTLRSINLRTRTGATIIAIERQGQHMTNPDPDLAFQPGDRVFLFGSPQQIHAARTLLGHEATQD